MTTLGGRPFRAAMMSALKGRPAGTHPSGDRLPRQRRDHPEGTLAVAVVVGTIGLLWFAFYLWSVLGSDPILW